MVINDFAVNGGAPSTIVSATTSQVYFPRLLGASIGAESVAPSATSAVGQLNVPGFNRLNGVQFSALIGGSVVGGAAAASTNVTIIVRAQTSANLASPSYTTIASTGAVALNPVNDGVSINFQMLVKLFGTTASGVVIGTQTSQLGTTRVAVGDLTANLSSINFGNSIPFGLVVGVAFSVAGAGNTATLNQFQIVAE